MKNRPNIVLIVADDQRFDTAKLMPNVRRRLMGHGTNFKNSFVTTPLCCPSRASTFTGQYASTHGVTNSKPPNGGFPVFKDDSTLATWLDEAGYKTGLFGKYLNGYEGTYKPPGWDRWHAFSGKANYYNYSLSENGRINTYGKGAPNYSTDLIGKKAVGFVRRSLKSSKPFFVTYTPYTPHAPFLPAPRHKDYVVPLFKPAPSFNEADVSDKPDWVQDLSLVDYIGVAQEWTKRVQMLQAVDDVVGKMLDVVRDAKQMKNTVFIYTSDNGKGLGEHRWDRKAAPYEESIRVPLIIRAPGKQVRTTNQFGLNIDLAPTIAHFAGIESPGAEGINLSKALLGERLGRQSFFIENWTQSYKNRDVGPQPYTGIRTAHWKFVSHQDGQQELYDMKGDRWEMKNLAGDPKYAGVMQRLSDRLSDRP